LDLQSVLNGSGHPISIIVLSAYDDLVGAKALEQGAFAVLRKPFDGGVLLAARRTAIQPTQ